MHYLINQPYRLKMKWQGGVIMIRIILNGVGLSVRNFRGSSHLCILSR